jgi:glycerophosphoryl diester phosphodiesterase
MAKLFAVVSSSLFAVGAIIGFAYPTGAAAQPPKPAAPPYVIGHRGLVRHAPENTLAAFAACIHLRMGFELDIRRTKDGVLVCLHDDDVKRTTNGKGKVSSFTLAELRKLDAGGWFDRGFAGERIPTLEEVFVLMKAQGLADLLVALDIKIEDDTLEGDIVALAKKHGVLKQVICIGRAITEPSVRVRLRAADSKVPVAALANKLENLEEALADKNADWIYIRFLPTREQVKKMHSQDKRVFLVGPLVMGHEPDNWRKAHEAGVDAVLTDYPLECQQLWRTPRTPD